MISALLAGLGLALSLIVAPGAQNVFLLRQGVRRQHSIVLALTCVASDILLIAVGVGGFGQVIEHAPWLFLLIKWAGVVFLTGYALLAAWRAVRPRGSAIEVAPAPEPQTDAPPPADQATGALLTATSTTTARVSPGTLVPALMSCLAFTWLNPHTYLDTVLLIGSVSTGYGEARWSFAIGAMIASAAWFALLTVAARYAARWLHSPRSWRVLDATIAVTMLAVAAGLVAA